MVSVAVTSGIHMTGTFAYAPYLTMAPLVITSHRLLTVVPVCPVFWDGCGWEANCFSTMQPSLFFL